MSELTPRISVVIPYHNEAATIETTLAMVAAQTLQPYEVILVDSSSTDDTFSRIEQWLVRHTDQSGIRFRNVQEGTNVPGSSKNAGARLAEGEYIAFMDCGQLFEPTWLELQWHYLQEHGGDIVSGGCLFSGTNILDKCAIAQTYGYNRWRPTIPSTMLTKSLFERVGPFLENLRAGYDAEWPIRLQRLGIDRGINPAVVIRYNGVNFANSLRSVFMKSRLYAEPTMNLSGYSVPYLYLIFFAVCMIVTFICIQAGIALGASYILFRGYFVPFVKSGGIAIIRENPDALIWLPIIGFFIDCGKMAGYGKALLKIKGRA